VTFACFSSIATAASLFSISAGVHHPLRAVASLAEKSGDPSDEILRRTLEAVDGAQGVPPRSQRLWRSWPQIVAAVRPAHLL
jgi:hypothetical protein